MRSELATAMAPYERPLGATIDRDVRVALTREAEAAARGRGARLTAAEAAARAVTALRRDLVERPA